MTWFGASVIYLWRKKPQNPDDPEHGDGPHRLEESVILVSADDPDEATQKASDVGREYASANSSDLNIDGEPGECVFVGVRKLREIRSLTLEGTDPKGTD